MLMDNNRCCYFSFILFCWVLIESLLGVVETLGLGAVIVLLITLGILFIISLISLFCCKKTNKKKNCCF
jgi:hypothetical protein